MSTYHLHSNVPTDILIIQHGTNYNGQNWRRDTASGSKCVSSIENFYCQPIASNDLHIILQIEFVTLKCNCMVQGVKCG